MKLLEYQAKELFKSYGISVNEGYVIRDPEEILEFDGEIALKAQVPTGGRGKAGGIRFVSDLEEARKTASELLKMSINGFRVKSILVEKKVKIARELYLSIIIDRSSRLPLLLACPEGGVEIESVNRSLLGKWKIHPFIGIRPYLTRDVSRFLGVDFDQMEALLNAAWRLFIDKECELLEINPLGIVDGHLIALDAKVTINDDAVFRHPELPPEHTEMTELEREAKEKGIAFVQLEGSIGVIANGAGLTMATLDNLSLHGGKGGVFLDLGGTDDVEKVVEAFELMVKAKPRVILLNIFGGITKCDTVANGVIEAKKRLNIEIPIVARIMGVNDDLAIKILKEAGIHALRNMDEACKKAAELEVEQ